MKEPINNYTHLGIAHFMLYPETLDDIDMHTDSMLSFIERQDIDTFDCCLPYSFKHQKILAKKIRKCGKSEICFVPHLFPFRKLSPSSFLPYEQAQVRLLVKDLINQAVLIDAKYFIFVSGEPALSDAKEENYNAFRDFCRWFCGELDNYGITALLEPFDYDVDKKFLYGPTKACIDLVESLKPDVNNLAIELDCAHVPLMGETFEQAIKTVGPYLKRVHLGNCVIKDRESPYYGDKHPPIGFEGGEIDVAQLIQIFRMLLKVGFLNLERTGSLILETTNWPEKSKDKTIAEGIECIHRAWEAV